MSKHRSDRTSDYYSRQRTWPLLLNVVKGAHFLDVGCGKGALGENLRETLASNVVGVELYPQYAEEASKRLDKVITGDFEALDLSAYNSGFNYVIFSDSLEHLVDPTAALLKAHRLLKPDGSILIAIPNIRNFRVTIPLVFLGRFEYQDEGLLDRTHLRFFTRSSIVALLKRCGFSADQIELDLPMSSKVGWLNALTLGMFSGTLTSHFFIRACKKEF